MLLKVAFNTNKHITLVMRDLFYFRKSIEGQQQRLDMTIGGNQTNNLISDRHRLLIIVMKNRYLKFISLVFQREKK
jgi:hypothetical protein